jgi:hypothetical protein
MPRPTQAQSSNQEGRILLAIQAIKQGNCQTVQAAAVSYDVPRTTLRDRIRGITSRRDSTPNSRKLTPYEESALVQYILDLDSRGFPPRPQAVQEMADLLLSERGESPVGKNWTTTFIKRRTEIKAKFSRKYDYKRAKCEDPKIIQGWFSLVRNTVAKYGILEQDIYNFDEAGFAMGVIATAKVVTSSEAKSRPKTIQPGNREWVSIIQGVNSYGWALPPFIIFKAQNHLSAWYEDSGLPDDWVITLSENGWTSNAIGYEWIQHFDRHTSTRTIGTYRLLILDGHESHLSAQFQHYCTEQKIITLCMPPHSSHILQPLDVSCFAPLKLSYGRQIETFVRNRLNHITKLEFLSAFKEAFKAAFIEQNIKSGFRATGLVPYEPQNVLSHLNLHLRTPTPPILERDNWTSKTPQTIRELDFQTEHIKNRVVRHQNSSPTSINDAISCLVKGAQVMMHSAVLLKAEVKALQAANEQKKRRERKRKRRIMQGGSLSVREGEDILQSAEVDAQVRTEVASEGSRQVGSKGRQKHCGLCGVMGHNSRTCQRHEDSIMIE